MFASPTQDAALDAYAEVYVRTTRTLFAAMQAEHRPADLKAVPQEVLLDNARALVTYRDPKPRLCRLLRVSALRLRALSRPHQGQGRAHGRLRQGQRRGLTIIGTKTYAKGSDAAATAR